MNPLENFMIGKKKNLDSPEYMEAAAKAAEATIKKLLDTTVRILRAGDYLLEDMPAAGNGDYVKEIYLPINSSPKLGLINNRGQVAITYTPAHGSTYLDLQLELHRVCKTENISVLESGLKETQVILSEEHRARANTLRAISSRLRNVG